jgi:dipeptide transport system ATP-binding protein
MALLEIRNLTVTFPAGRSTFPAVSEISLDVDKGEVLGVVGESGSGKSTAMLSLMGIVPYPGRINADRMAFDGKDLLTISDRERRRLIGKDIAMVFQDPTTSLNPCFKVGFQLGETLQIHLGLSRFTARARAMELLAQVGIPEPAALLDAYPHQLSGGMSQRVMIAMAIACDPRLLIADEPTTALDVTIQAQILDLLAKLQRERGMSLILITHNMGVVAELADRVAVMYAGQIMEIAPAEAIFSAPQHPYTAALLAALPERAAEHTTLATIPGVVPGAFDRPDGCLFSPRCPWATPHCRDDRPTLSQWQHGSIRCFYPLGDTKREAKLAASRDVVSTKETPK